MKRDWVLHYPRRGWRLCYGVFTVIYKLGLANPYNPLAWPAFAVMLMLGCKLEVTR